MGNPHAPDMRLKSLALILTPIALALPAGAAVNFEKEILPFLEKKCVQCHKAPFEKDGKTVKPKSGLRFDAAWAIQAGSENGAVLVAGKSGESAMFERVTLPSDDDDFMPPKDKADPLTPAEVELLKSWIDEGADFGEWRNRVVVAVEGGAGVRSECRGDRDSIVCGDTGFDSRW